MRHLTRSVAMSCLAAGLVVGSATASTITFDEFPATNDDSALTNLYAGMGVVFGGDNSGTWGGNSAGDPGNWDLEGTNGPAFLGDNGANNGDTYVSTILFSSPTGSVSFDVSRSLGSSDGQTLTVFAKHGAVVLAMDTVTLGPINTWSTLSFTVPGIDNLVLDGSENGFSPYGLDNLTFGDTVPEPSTLLLLGCGIAALAGIRRFRGGQA